MKKYSIWVVAILLTMVCFGAFAAPPSIGVKGGEAGDATIYIRPDEGDDADDKMRIVGTTTGNLSFRGTSGTNEVASLDMSTGAFSVDGAVTGSSFASTGAKTPVVTGSGSGTNTLIQAGVVTMHAGTIYTNTFPTAFDSGTVPIVTATYTEDPGDVRPIFMTSTASNTVLINVTASKNFAWTAIGMNP